MFWKIESEEVGEINVKQPFELHVMLRVFQRPVENTSVEVISLLFPPAESVFKFQ